MPEPTHPRKNVTPGFQVRYSDRFKRQALRKDIRTFLWGAWLMLFIAIAMAADTLQALRTGEWVDLLSDGTLTVPWWMAAIASFAVLLLGIGCFHRYVKLRETEPAGQPCDAPEDQD